jgi:hypothetical protein
VVIGTTKEVSIWSIKDPKKSHTFDLSGRQLVDDVVMTPDTKYIAIAAFGIGNNDDIIVKCLI